MRFRALFIARILVGSAAVAETTPPHSDPPAAHPSEAPMPAVTPQTFCDELVRASRNRKAESDKVAAEAARLEKLATDIAHARDALRTETERLEGLLKQVDASHAAAPKAAAAAMVVSAHPEVIAKSMRGLAPDQAAQVLKKLDHALAARVIATMRPQDASAVLGKLEPSEAAQLLTEAAQEKSP